MCVPFLVSLVVFPAGRAAWAAVSAVSSPLCVLSSKLGRLNECNSMLLSPLSLPDGFAEMET